MSIDDDFFEVEAFLESKKNPPMGYWNRLARYVADLEADVDELRSHNSVLRAALQAGQNHLIQDIMDLVMFSDIHKDQTPGAYENSGQIQHEQLIRSLIMTTLEKTYGVSLRTKAQRQK